MTVNLAKITVNLTKPTEYCARCFALCAPTGNLYIDPLCTACKADLRARNTFSDLADNNPILLANFFADSRILLGEPIIDPFDRYYNEVGSWNL